jgi:hypothetical protein
VIDDPLKRQLRIDVALVDRLLAFIAGRRSITRLAFVSAVAVIGRVAVPHAEGFVTDLAHRASSNDSEVLSVPLLTDALLDLRADLEAVGE